MTYKEQASALATKLAAYAHYCDTKQKLIDVDTLEREINEFVGVMYADDNDKAAAALRYYGEMAAGHYDEAAEEGHNPCWAYAASRLRVCIEILKFEAL